MEAFARKRESAEHESKTARIRTFSSHCSKRLEARSQSPKPLGSHILKVLSWQSCFGVLPWQFWFSFPSCPVLTVLPRLSCPGHPALTLLSKQSCLEKNCFGHPVLSACSACPALAVKFGLSHSGRPVLALVLAVLF
jgi:hypothetical protein